MKFFVRKFRRRGLKRLRGYDYSKPGAYFVTICTHGKKLLFSEIQNKQIILNDFGQIVDDAWHDLPNHHHHVRIDEYIIMPDHFHGIVILEDYTKPSEYMSAQSLIPSTAFNKRHALPEVIRGFKTFSARRINVLRDTKGTPVWKRKYHERIIPTKHVLEIVRRYIRKNPQNLKPDQINRYISF